VLVNKILSAIAPKESQKLWLKRQPIAAKGIAIIQLEIQTKDNV